MSAKKVKTAAKMYTSNLESLEKIIVTTMEKISGIVGASLGPGGRNIIIESELVGIPNKNTKDGVTIFRSLGSQDPYEHLIIEQTRDVAVKTVNEAGDGPMDLLCKILTPTGFITMGEIEKGMEICGTNGTTQTVLEVYDKGLKDNYRVHFGDKSVARCCEDHLWDVTTAYGAKKTIPLKEIMKDYTTQQKDGTNSYKYYVQTTAVEFKENKEKMPIDPYLLGVLLGDGSLTGTHRSSIEISLGKKKEHILNKLILPEGVEMRSTWVESKSYFRVKLTGTDQDGSVIKNILDSIGLLGTSSHTKFIPNAYLFSSIESRTKLLQGLIDTDGNVNKRGLFEFSSVSKQLAEDFANLCKSLGKNITTREKDRSKSTGYSTNNIFIVQELKGYKYGNKIVKIEPLNETVPMRCIKVSNPDNLYITDDFVVTHNTTTATIIASALIRNLFDFCKNNPKYSPQRLTRLIAKTLKERMKPIIDKESIKITNKNRHLLKKVAQVSANGDEEMAKYVIEAFETVGYGSSSHVTIQELSGPSGYQVELIEGFPIDKGYEESIGKFHPVFINDPVNQKCILEKPLFILFDGVISDIVKIQSILQKIAIEYVNGNSDFCNVVIVAHGFNDKVLSHLALNFPNPNTINVVPLKTPMNQIINSQLNFLLDLSAFTGATVFGMNDSLEDALPEDLGTQMEKIEIYRFRSTVVGDPIQENIEVRAEEIGGQAKQSESKIEKAILEERLGRLTNGIARFKIFGSSAGELKEKADRAEDAVCAVRAAISHGCLAGGCRTLINICLDLIGDNNEVYDKIIVPSLLSPFYKLLENAGYTEEEISELLEKMLSDKKLVYDVENGIFGDAQTLGIFDATLAVEQALNNAVGIAGVMGTLGGIVAFPRDNQLENNDVIDRANFSRTIEHANDFKNEANERA